VDPTEPITIITMTHAPPSCARITLLFKLHRRAHASTRLPQPRTDAPSPLPSPLTPAATIYALVIRSCRQQLDDFPPLAVLSDYVTHHLVGDKVAQLQCMGMGYGCVGMVCEYGV
jgi:hypothetical protein